MPIYRAPVEDYRFLLNEVLELEKHRDLPGFADLSPDLVDDILGNAGKFCEEVLQPLNQTGDEEGCHFQNGTVTTPKGFKEAYKAYSEAGWGGLGAPEEAGGAGMPPIITMAGGKEAELITGIAGNVSWAALNRAASLSATGIWRGENVALTLASDQPLILFRALRGDVGLHGTIAAFLRAHDVPVKACEEVGTIHAGMGLVLAGVGVCIIPETSRMVHIDGVVTRPFAEATTRVSSTVCWRHQDSSRSLDAWVRHVRELVRTGESAG